MTTAERLKQAMGAKKMDQAALAKASGVTQGAISAILVGKTKNSRFLPDIADALGVDIKWLRGKTEKQGAPGPRQPSGEPTTIALPVQLPSEEVLIERFLGLLEGGRELSMDALAQTLAENLQAVIGPRKEPGSSRTTRKPARKGDGPPSPRNDL